MKPLRYHPRDRAEAIRNTVDGLRAAIHNARSLFVLLDTAQSAAAHDGDDALFHRLTLDLQHARTALELAQESRRQILAIHHRAKQTQRQDCGESQSDSADRQSITAHREIVANRERRP